MQWLYFLGVIAAVNAGREVYERLGYFWHITDIHYDGHVYSHGDARKGCWRSDYEGGKGKGARRQMGRFGDYSCDSTWELIESAAQLMMTRHYDNVEFVLWTGDGISHSARRLPDSIQRKLLQNLTDLLGKTFKSQFVFPALGHDDPFGKEELTKMWSRWLPTDSLKTFQSGGYYIFERKMLKLQIVVLNTNLMKRGENDEDALQQWVWLDSVLAKFQKNGETVYLVGHVPPGLNERQRGSTASKHFAYLDYHNKRYLDIVRKYAGIIAGQFFGHLHSDTFKVIYSTNGKPISWAMVAPSVTPKRTIDGPNNPGLRLYKFDKDTGQVFDYTQFYLDLSAANANENRIAEWAVEYNFSTYYSINEINAGSLHALADKFTQDNPFGNSVFNKYYRANSVRINNNPSGCDATCAHTHFCAITRVDYDEFHQCMQTAPSALSASRSFTSRPIVLLVLFVSVVINLLV
ncbi:acid sphingomyelinase-like phosphodiesterase 3b isoform X1 [Diorhabda carinulata]|uniref:acid sphingomyelinase-like phosphodiesterase 3b isoform X1 n=1 Tax=Diorhabda carinulata TaxID=1163345 RepID=UPI0025A0DFC6|nr:acid sphingomyelinase-like phosphodiesterase 3b isoform X1 [Diorhabda carinulata]